MFYTIEDLKPCPIWFLCKGNIPDLNLYQYKKILLMHPPDTSVYPSPPPVKGAPGVSKGQRPFSGTP